ncbi:tail assembly chaperone [Rhodobacter phage RcCWillis]|nr:tail assembly chaperone [Rhodobacter phage RcCWillis]
MDTPETFEIPSEPFEFNGKTVLLRGLTLPHIIYIVRENRPALEKLFEKAISGQVEANAVAVAMELAEDFAPVVGRLIACGMGKPELSETMAQLPAGAQIVAMEIIIRLTLKQEGGLEKLMEIVTQTLIRANQELSRRA